MVTVIQKYDEDGYELCRDEKGRLFVRDITSDAVDVKENVLEPVEEIQEAPKKKKFKL